MAQALVAYSGFPSTFMSNSRGATLVLSLLQVLYVQNTVGLSLDPSGAYVCFLWSNQPSFKWCYTHNRSPYPQQIVFLFREIEAFFPVIWRPAPTPQLSSESIPPHCLLRTAPKLHIGHWGHVFSAFTFVRFGTRYRRQENSSDTLSAIFFTFLSCNKLQSWLHIHKFLCSSVPMPTSSAVRISNLITSFPPIVPDWQKTVVTCCAFSSAGYNRLQWTNTETALYHKCPGLLPKRRHQRHTLSMDIRCTPLLCYLVSTYQFGQSTLLFRKSFTSVNVT